MCHQHHHSRHDDTTRDRPRASETRHRRVSDREREQTCERLRSATGEGRLDPSELEERLAAVWSARTYDDLDAIVTDLPADAHERSTGSHRPSGRVNPIAAFILAMLLMLAIWMATGAGYFWPIWPAIGWAPWLVISWWPAQTKPTARTTVPRS